jgi:hypothetical protein
MGFIGCTKIGCRGPTHTCQSCNSRLCSWCCEDKQEELAAEIKKKSTKTVELTIIVEVPKDTEQALLAYELGEAVKLLRSLGRVEPIATMIKDHKP